jgi:hypothetical protein
MWFVYISTYVLVWLYLFCAAAREHVTHGTILSLFLTFLFRFLFICLFFSLFFYSCSSSYSHPLPLSSFFVVFFTSFFLSISLWFQFIFQGQRQGIFVCAIFSKIIFPFVPGFCITSFSSFLSQKYCGLSILHLCEWQNGDNLVASVT